jgi:hypothetical protein
MFNVYETIYKNKKVSRGKPYPIEGDRLFVVGFVC